MFFIIKIFLFIPPSYLLESCLFRIVSALTTFMLFTCLMYIYFLLVFIFLCTLRISSLKHIPSFFKCLMCLFFMSFLRALHQPYSQWRFSFSKWGRRTDSSPTYVYRTPCGIAKTLPTNGCFFLFFLFTVIEPGDFSIDQIKFICWSQGIRTMSLQRYYNVSDVETALQQPYFSQLWQADYHSFTIFICRF